MARKRPGSVVSAKALIRVEGTEEILDKIQSLMSYTTARFLKQLYVTASIPVWEQAKKNVQLLPISSRLKKILDAEIMINSGTPTKQHALMGVSQHWGVKKLGRDANGKKVFIPNPYWFEFGTSRGIKPTAFFRPAVSQSKAKVVDWLTQGFFQIVDNINEMHARGVTSATQIRWNFYTKR